MATYTAAAGAQIQSAVDLMEIGTAYETPLAEDVIERLAIASELTGYLGKGAFKEAVRDRPFSTLLKWGLAMGVGA